MCIARSNIPNTQTLSMRYKCYRIIRSINIFLNFNNTLPRNCGIIGIIIYVLKSVEFACTSTEEDFISLDPQWI